MTKYLIKRPMIIAAVGCTISAVCGFYSKTALIICFLAVLFFTCFGFLKRNITLITVCFFIFAVIFSCFFTLSKIESLNQYDRTLTAEICILDSVYEGESISLSEAEVIKSDTLPRGTKLCLWHESAPLEIGNILKATLKPQAIDPEYKAANYSKGIYLSGNMTYFKLSGSDDPVLSKVRNLRNYIKTTLFSNMSYESAATMSALIFGESGYFSDEFNFNVKASGVAHVMVVSGMHLAVLVSMVLKISNSFVYSPYLKATIMILTTCMLCTLCGFTMSIMRAGVTYIIMALGLIIKRQYSGEIALATAVILILIFSPFAIMHIGFQLSVLSTFGILAISAPICDILDTKKLNTPFLWLIKSVILSLSALLMTLPVVIYVFGYVSTVSVITNLLIDIPVNLCLCASVITLLLYRLFPFISSVIFALIDYIVKYINAVINYLGSRSFATVSVNKLGTVASVLVIFLVFRLMLTCKKNQNMLKLKELNDKISLEGGGSIKWQLLMKKP